MKAIYPTEIQERVYCAVVDKTHNFVLEDYIVTGNCFSASCSVSGWSFIRLAIQCGLERRVAAELVRQYGLPAEPAAHRTKPQAPEEPILLGRYHVDWTDLSQHPAVQIAADYLMQVRRVRPEVLNAFCVGVDRQEGLIVFPQFRDGVCVGIATRSPTAKVMKTRYPKGGYLYPNDPPTHGDRELALVEGQLDALRVESAVLGDPNQSYSLALCGSALSARQQDLLRHHRIVLFLDNDLAGIAATTKVLARLGPHRCRVVTQYWGLKDAGDMDDEQIRESTRTAIPGMKYVEEVLGRRRLALVKAPQPAEE